MKLHVTSIIEVEGDPAELAMYTHCLISIFRIEHDLEEKTHDRDEAEKIREAMNKSFAELMKREMEEEEWPCREENERGDDEKG